MKCTDELAARVALLSSSRRTYRPAAAPSTSGAGENVQGQAVSSVVMVLFAPTPFSAVRLTARLPLRLSMMRRRNGGGPRGEGRRGRRPWLIPFASRARAPAPLFARRLLLGDPPEDRGARRGTAAQPTSAFQRCSTQRSNPGCLRANSRTLARLQLRSGLWRTHRRSTRAANYSSRRPLGEVMAGPFRSPLVQVVGNAMGLFSGGQRTTATGRAGGSAATAHVSAHGSACPRRRRGRQAISASRAATRAMPAGCSPYSRQASASVSLVPGLELRAEARGAVDAGQQGQSPGRVSRPAARRRRERQPTLAVPIPIRPARSTRNVPDRGSRGSWHRKPGVQKRRYALRRSHRATPGH